MALVAPDWPKTPSPATSSTQMDSSPARQQTQDSSTGAGSSANTANQQPQAAAWTPSPTAAPFYPSFTPFYAPGQQAPPGQQQFYDPNFAQWAYHQMILAQQPHLMNQQPQVLQPFPPQHQQGQQPQQQLFSPFNPSPRPSPVQEMPANYQGFHPYRRPGRPQQDSQHGHHGAPQPAMDWTRQQPPPQPPYARGEASSSQTSLGGSSNGSSRSRVNSNNTPPSSVRSRPQPAQEQPRRATPPAVTNFGRSSPVPGGRAPHQRVDSTSSERSSSSTTRGVRPASPSPAAQPTPRPSAAPAKPSPLSQGQSVSAAEKRMSKDDSELLSESAAHAAASPLGRPSGLKGRLRRAFSFNASQTLEAGGTKDQPGQAPVTDPDAPGAPPKRSRAASLFNPRFNRSTDNISLSSTVSSASVMIRKIGNMGKLARRNTLSGITGIFKDKKDGEGASKSRAEPTVSLATAEFDRVPTSDPDMVGLSPAAQLARQHTLRSNAQEAAERAKAALDRRAGSSSSHRGAAPRDIYEDGRRIIVEIDEEDSGSDTDRGRHSDEDDAFDEEDLTIRMNNTGLDDDDQDDDGAWAVGIRRSLERVRQPVKGILKRSYDQDAYLESVLKASHPSQTNRPRSNSYGPSSQAHAEPGPLARIPSPDPDHIDGLHHKDGSSHGHSEGTPRNNPHLPRFSFEFTGEIKLTTSPPPSPPPSSNGHSKERESIKDMSPYNHPSFNSSAPVLSLALGKGAALTPRSATVPAKRISFAPNLSIYDTFSPTMYDRRSEAATCNRLTPALAQRIKEELNSYKMEEMEVHVASRVHTHFFV